MQNTIKWQTHSNVISSYGVDVDNICARTRLSSVKLKGICLSIAKFEIDLGFNPC